MLRESMNTGSRSHRLEAAGTLVVERDTETDVQVPRKGCGWWASHSNRGRAIGG